MICTLEVSLAENCQYLSDDKRSCRAVDTGCSYCKKDNIAKKPLMGYQRKPRWYEEIKRR